MVCLVSAGPVLAPMSCTHLDMAISALEVQHVPDGLLLSFCLDAKLKSTSHPSNHGALRCDRAAWGRLRLQVVAGSRGRNVFASAAGIAARVGRDLTDHMRVSEAL